MYVYKCTCAYVFHNVCGGLGTAVLCFYHVGPGNLTPIVRFGSRYLYLLSYLSGSQLYFLIFSFNPLVQLEFILGQIGR